jgi:phosphate transport system permease protein
MRAIRIVGLAELFSTRFAGVLTTGADRYGLVPAMWGTTLAVTLAIAIALPVSIAMAVFASEFPLRFVGKPMGAILGVLAGIPPIVYALLSIAFAEVFIRPKFAGQGLPPGHLPSWWVPGMVPWEDSTLLGGIMLAFLIIPFIAPLVSDAMANVPRELKEASLSLGASRWHTLKKVILPWASGGVISATALGALKAMGDLLIVAWVIGYESGMPNPVWDILERTALLTATGAGLAGGFEATNCSGTKCSVAYFAGFMLLVLALAILIVAGFLQRRLQRRFSA